MKYCLSFLFSLFLSVFVTAQDAELIENVDEAPLFKSCKNAKNSKECFKNEITLYILKNLDLNKISESNSGTAYAQFIVNSEGKIDDVQVRSNVEALKNATRELIQQMKIEEPAYKNGEPVAIKYTVPIRFKSNQFSSYDDFYAEEAGKKKVLSFEKVAKLPVIDNCSKMNCLKDLIENQTLEKLKAKGYSKKQLNEVRFTFMIDPEGRMQHLLVRTLPAKFQNEIKEILGNLEIQQPAKDKNGKPTAVRYSYNFD
ncbi:energy transducer TonB [Gramella sp. AN32]|uniref:Energy transducer TonB n=1 Tax=Christiangramia antarctica TaxID=2058158 RepID=A0ABW5XAY2_9FLAO|nr:energy transducer TonB [Gramella sp. AN32]